MWGEGVLGMSRGSWEGVCEGEVGRVCVRCVRGVGREGG